MSESDSVQGAAPNPPTAPQAGSFWSGIMGGFRVQRARLTSDIAATRLGVARLPDAPLSTEASRSWKPLAEEALAQAEAAATAGRLQEGWKCLGAARRLSINGYSKDERRVLAEALRLEAADKLSKWRRGTVHEALARGDEGQGRDVGVDALIAAARFRDEALDNVHFKRAHFRNQLIILCAILVGATVALLLASEPSWFAASAASGSTQDTVPHRLIWGVALFGIIGGCLSSLQSLARTSTTRRIPKQISESYVTAFRPVMGAAGALASYAFLMSELLPLDATSRAPAVVLSVAFVAGFSERLVLRGVQAVAGDDAKPKPKPKPKEP